MAGELDQLPNRALTRLVGHDAGGIVGATTTETLLDGRLSKEPQVFTDEEKAQLQANIGLGDDDVPDFRVIFENGLV